MPTSSKRGEDVAREAARPSRGLAGELWGFLRQNKKWWLGPILIVLALATLLVILGGSAIAPFIYTVF